MKLDRLHKNDDLRTMMVAEVANEVIDYLTSLGNATLTPASIGQVQCTKENTQIIFKTLQVQVCYTDDDGKQQTATATLLGFINPPNA